MNTLTIDFQRLDIRKLIAAGREPLPAIRSRVNNLTPGQGLVVIAPFLPSPLIELLQSEGFLSRIEPTTGSDWVVYFWKEPLVSSP